MKNTALVFSISLFAVCAVGIAAASDSGLIESEIMAITQHYEPVKVQKIQPAVTTSPMPVSLKSGLVTTRHACEGRACGEARAAFALTSKNQQTKGAPMWYGRPKERNTSRELVKTVDLDGVPWWDDSISQFDQKDFTDDFEYAVDPTGNDWKWWVNQGFGPKRDGYLFPGDRNWTHEIDYEHFELYSDEELAHKREMAEQGGPFIRHARIDCQNNPMLDECAQILGRISVRAAHDRHTERAVEELFLVPKRPEFHWGRPPALAPMAVPVMDIDISKIKPMPVPTVPPLGPPPMMLVPDFAPAQGMPSVVSQAHTCDPGMTVFVESCAGGKCVDCPFDTAAECEIWVRKPTVRETVAPRAPRLRQLNVDTLVALIRTGIEITPEVQDAKPLVARYNALRAMSRACCSSGMIHRLETAGASQDLIYKFMVDDANFYGFGQRCLMMPDAHLDKFLNTATARVVADVRNGCLCRNKQWFRTLLAPFQQIGAEAPEFASQRFAYTYMDGLNREVTTSINTDVKAVLNQLEHCP